MLKLAVNKSIFWMLLTFSIKRSFAGETPVTLLITSFTWDPKGLYIRNKKWKLHHMSGLYCNRDLRTVCGLLCIHGSPHNLLQTAQSSTRKQHHQQKCCWQGNNQQIRTSSGHVLYQGQATQASTARLRETYPCFPTTQWQIQSHTSGHSLGTN